MKKHKLAAPERTGRAQSLDEIKRNIRWRVYELYERQVEEDGHDLDGWRTAEDDSSATRTNWNAWILICLLAIVITFIILIEMHLRSLTIHSTVPPYQGGLWWAAVATEQPLLGPLKGGCESDFLASTVALERAFRSMGHRIPFHLL